jgi:hypothetical protein
MEQKRKNLSDRKGPGMWGVKISKRFFFQLHVAIKILQANERSINQKHAEKRRDFELRIQDERKKYDEQSQENVNQIKQLKVKCPHKNHTLI